MTPVGAMGLIHHLLYINAVRAAHGKLIENIFGAYAETCVLSKRNIRFCRNVTTYNSFNQSLLDNVRRTMESKPYPQKLKTVLLLSYTLHTQLPCKGVGTVHI